MTGVIAGAHGKIALRLGAMRAARSTPVRGIIRNPNHTPDLRSAGVTPVVFDLESDQPGLPEIVAGAAAVVFAAGAGPGSGDARKQTIDRDGAIRLIDACHQSGVARYVIVSALGARDPSAPGSGFAAYLRAKAQADHALAASGLDYTIVRPGALTDTQPTGHIRAAELLPGGSIPRADVAATLVAVLEAPNTIGKSFDLVTGKTPITQAIAAL
jgi:uncharacterized protein YbjT (DUF2867 family)